MIILRQKKYSRRDYEGLDKKAKEELKEARKVAAIHLNTVRNSNNFGFNRDSNRSKFIRNNNHRNAISEFNNGFLKEERDRLLKDTKKRRLARNGKIALATGGVVAAGIGAKKLVDKKKAKKEEKK
jgi:hypothetical protein